jgi:hypothetical protein
MTQRIMVFNGLGRWSAGEARLRRDRAIAGGVARTAGWSSGPGRRAGDDERALAHAPHELADGQ